MCFSQTYTFKVSKDMYESIKVDANKESETFSLSHASSGKKEGDGVYDFNKVRNYDKRSNKSNSSKFGVFFCFDKKLNSFFLCDSNI